MCYPILSTGDYLVVGAALAECGGTVNGSAPLKTGCVYFYKLNSAGSYDLMYSLNPTEFFEFPGSGYARE